MAANTIVTAPRQPLVRLRPTPADRVGLATDAATRAAARTAPRGEGLATVVALPVRRTTAASPAASQAASLAAPQATPGREAASPTLRVVPAAVRPRRAARRIVGLLIVATMLVAGLLGTVMASADEPVAAGHVVLQPGETLWDVAVRSAPAGVDPRRQLDAVRRLNGFGPGALDAWTVVLIPAP